MDIIAIIISILALAVSGYSVYVSIVSKKIDEYRITELSADNLDNSTKHVLRLAKTITNKIETKAVGKEASELSKRGLEEAGNIHTLTAELLTEYERKKSEASVKQLINFNIRFQKMQKRIDELKGMMEESKDLLENSSNKFSSLKID